METYQSGSNVLFILLGAIMVLAMHAGFAFLEVGTVRKKNQVNALVKILTDFCVSAIAYFFIGYTIAYGANFFSSAEVLSQKSGYEMVKFFFLLTFAAAIPAIISGGIAERAKFHPQSVATLMLVGSDPPLTVMMYGRMREGATPVLNAVSLFLMLASAAIALVLMRRARDPQA